MEVRAGPAGDARGLLTRAGPERRLVAAGAVAAALLTAGCATTPPTTNLAAAARPGVVQGHLTSAVKRAAYTAAELADPATRAFVQRCERVGDDDCRERWVSEDRRRRFSLTADAWAIARFEVGGLEAQRSYAVECQFMDPAGSVVRLTRGSFETPRGTSSSDVFTQSCAMGLDPASPTGAWAVSLTVNGETASVLRFEVVLVDGGQFV